MAKRAQQKSREERIAAHDELDREDVIVRVVFNFIKPGTNMKRISRSWETCCGI